MGDLFVDTNQPDYAFVTVKFRKGQTPDTAKAFARLILAAPHLLAACEDATTAIYDAMHAGNLSRNYHDDVMDKIEAAIKKARGE